MWIGLEADHPARWADAVGHDHAVHADIGADVESDIALAQHLVEQPADLWTEGAVKIDVPLAKRLRVDVQPQILSVVDDRLVRPRIARRMYQADDAVGSFGMESAGRPGQGMHEGLRHVWEGIRTRSGWQRDPGECHPGIAGFGARCQRFRTPIIRRLPTERLLARPPAIG